MKAKGKAGRPKKVQLAKRNVSESSDNESDEQQPNNQASKKSMSNEELIKSIRNCSVKLERLKTEDISFLSNRGEDSQAEMGNVFSLKNERHSSILNQTTNAVEEDSSTADKENEQSSHTTDRVIDAIVEKTKSPLSESANIENIVADQVSLEKSPAKSGNAAFESSSECPKLVIDESSPSVTMSEDRNDSGDSNRATSDTNVDSVNSTIHGAVASSMDVRATSPASSYYSTEGNNNLQNSKNIDKLPNATINEAEGSAEPTEQMGDSEAIERDKQRSLEFSSEDSFFETNKQSITDYLKSNPALHSSIESVDSDVGEEENSEKVPKSSGKRTDVGEEVNSEKVPKSRGRRTSVSKTKKTRQASSSDESVDEFQERNTKKSRRNRGSKHDSGDSDDSNFQPSKKRASHLISSDESDKEVTEKKSTTPEKLVDSDSEASRQGKSKKNSHRAKSQRDSLSSDSEEETSSAKANKRKPMLKGPRSRRNNTKDKKKIIDSDSESDVFESTMDESSKDKAGEIIDQAESLITGLDNNISRASPDASEDHDSDSTLGSHEEEVYKLVTGRKSKNSLISSDEEESPRKSSKHVTFDDESGSDVSKVEENNEEGTGEIDNSAILEETKEDSEVDMEFVSQRASCDENDLSERRLSDSESESNDKLEDLPKDSEAGKSKDGSDLVTAETERDESSETSKVEVEALSQDREESASEDEDDSTERAARLVAYSAKKKESKQDSQVLQGAFQHFLC